MRAAEILEEHLTDEANVALERGLPTVRSTGWGGFPGDRILVERQQPLVDAVSDVFGECPEKLYPLILAAVRHDAAPDALLKLRNVLAREIARYNAADILTAQRHEAEELSHG